MFISEATKITLIKFIIGAVFLIYQAHDPKEWYENENLVSEV